MTLCEATNESILQLALQLYIVFNRADRQPLTSQVLSLSSSILFIAKSHLEENFTDKPNEPLLKKLTILPQKLFAIVFFCGSLALSVLFFRLLVGYKAIYYAILGFITCLMCICPCICMKAKISQGKRWYNQKYKGVLVLSLTMEAIFFIMLPINC